MQRAKLSSGVLLLSAGAIEEQFEGKPHGKFTKVNLFLHDKSPSHRALAIQKKRAYVVLKFLDLQSCSPLSGPVGLPPVPWTEKAIEVSLFFSDAEVIAAAENWLDGQFSGFFFFCKT